MIDEAQLRQMTPAERRALARALAAVDYPHPLAGVSWIGPGRSRLGRGAIALARRLRVGALVSAACCVALAAWIVVLALTLQRGFQTRHWAGAWVGFDVVELLAFAATAWAFWRGRQIVIACLLVTATLLYCDAWFDVILDLGTPGIWGSVASAGLIELPLATAMIFGARRLIRLSALVAVGESGRAGERPPAPPLWKIPLFGAGPRT